MSAVSPLLVVLLVIAPSCATPDPVRQPTPLPAPAVERTDVLLAAARAARDRDDTATARANAEEAIDCLLQRDTKADAAFVSALSELGEIANACGSLDAALRARERVVDECERLFGPDHEALLEARWNLALTLQERGDLQGALALEQAVHAARSSLLPPEDRGLLAVKLGLASTLADLGDLNGARELQEVVHETLARVRPPDDPDLLVARTNLAATRAELGDIEGANELFEAVLATWTRLLPPDHANLLAVKLNLAITRAELGDLDGALELEESVVAAYERTLPAGHPDLLRAQLNLATTRMQRGDLEGARELQEAVLIASERALPPDHPDLLAARQNLAVTRQALGDTRGAYELFEGVHDARTRVLPPGHPDLLLAKRNLGVALRALGDIQGAHELFEEVLEGSTSLFDEDHPDLLAAKTNLAGTRRELGDIRGAYGLFDEVHAARTRILPPEHLDLIASKHNLAVTCGALGNLERARELEEQVLAARARVLPPDHPELLEAELEIATLRSRMGDATGSREAIRSALTSLCARCAALQTDSPRAAREGVAAGIEALSRALSLAAGPELDLEFLGTLESLRLVPVANARLGHALAARPGLEREVRAIADARRRIHDLAAAGVERAEDVETWRQELLALGERRDRAERELRAELPGTAALVDPAMAARNLSADAAAASFLRYERWSSPHDPGATSEAGVDSFLALLLRPDGTVARVELGPATEVEDLVGSWRLAVGKALPGALATDADDDLPALASRGLATESAVGGDATAAGIALRARILDPLLAAAGPGTRTLHIVPDDALHLVPLDALPIEADTPVGSRIAVHVETSLARLAQQATEEPDAHCDALVLVGGVEFDAGATADATTITEPDRSSALASFAPLPATLAEAEDIAALHSAVFDRTAILLSGAGATKEQLAEFAPRARYLHVSTHGWFASGRAAPAPGSTSGAEVRARRTLTGVAPDTLCGLALSGANCGPDEHGRMSGILTAEELATFDLSSCRLAVLSACETNVGIRRAGQGIQSLQTALHSAGARTSITSLWRVDDAATRRLFVIFYARLWEDGLGPADALWQAKSTLRAEGHPARDWAGWVLSGDPGAR